MKTQFKKRTYFSIIAILFFSIFLIGSCEKNGQDPKDTIVSFTPCRHEITEVNTLSGKIEINFTDKGVEITCFDFTVACDFTTVNVTHTFVNGFLNITQQGSPHQADCICYTDVSYTIEGIS